MLGRRAEREVEQRLREERPEPPDELVQRLSAEVDAHGDRPVSTRIRIGAAVGIAALTAAALAASGSLTDAGGKVGGAAASVSNTFGALAHTHYAPVASQPSTASPATSAPTTSTVAASPATSAPATSAGTAAPSTSAPTATTGATSATGSSSPAPAPATTASADSSPAATSSPSTSPSAAGSATTSASQPTDVTRTTFSEDITPADAEYTSAGYYCFRKPKENDDEHSNAYDYLNPEPYIQNTADYDSYISDGWTAYRYDGASEIQCNGGNKS